MEAKDLVPALGLTHRRAAEEHLEDVALDDVSGEPTGLSQDLCFRFLVTPFDLEPTVDEVGGIVDLVEGQPQFAVGMLVRLEYRVHRLASPAFVLCRGRGLGRGLWGHALRFFFQDLDDLRHGEALLFQAVDLFDHAQH